MCFSLVVFAFPSRLQLGRPLVRERERETGQKYIKWTLKSESLHFEFKATVLGRLAASLSGAAPAKRTRFGSTQESDSPK